MNSDELKTKLSHYYNLRNHLKTMNIDAEVNKRLEAQREEMRAKVEAEVKADIEKCTHYVELLDTLVKEQCDREEAAEAHQEECAPEEVAEKVAEGEQPANETVEGGN